MVINENLLKQLLDVKQLLFYVFTILIMVILTITIILFSKIHINNTSMELNKTILKNVTTDSDIGITEWLLTKCNAINCNFVVLSNKKIYKVDLYNKEFTKLFNVNVDEFIKTTIMDFKIVIDYQEDGRDSVLFIINNNEYIKTLFNTLCLLFFTTIILFLVLHFISQYNKYKNNIYEKGNYKLYSENKVQTNISEMINHELSAPVAILKTISYEIRDIIFENTSEDISDGKYELLESFDFAINRIDSIINLLSINKKIKHEIVNDEFISIKALFENIMTSINNLHVTKLEYTILNSYLTEEYSIDKIPIGDFLNILHVLLTNANEAGATDIEFSVYNLKNNKLDLFIKDNGSGIRNSSGEIIKNNAIFEYGYSTKNLKGEHIIENSWYIKLLSKLGITIIKTDTNRGIGLYVNKLLLEKYGGDIVLHDTTTSGTIFKITVPVKKIPMCSVKKKITKI